MDFRDKGTAWFGKIGKKFDTFCSEIDSIISQDTLEYAESKWLTAKENIKLICSEFMQEMLPDSLKETPSVQQATKESGLPSSEMIENDVDEGHKIGPSNFTALDLFPPETAKDGETDPSVDRKSSDGKETGSNIYLLKAMLFPSKTADLEASENDALGMTSVVSGFDGEVKMGLPESITCRLASSAKAVGTSRAAGVKVDSSPILGSSVDSGVYYNGKFLEIKDPSAGNGLSETSGQISGLAMGMDSESFNVLTIDGSCILVDGNKICSLSDFQAGYGTSQAAGSGDDTSEPCKAVENCLARSLHASKSTPIDQDLEETDWEIV